MQIEDGVVDLDLPRFDPRVVEDVVENAEEISLDDRMTLTCWRWRSFNGPSAMSRNMPRTPFIGVRISWLIVARNSDLARAGLFGAGASAIMVLHLFDEPGIRFRQLSRPLCDQPLQILLVLAELGVGALALLLQLTLLDALVAEHADRVGHVGELVAPTGRHGHVEAAGREALHDPVKRREPVDEIAMHV